MDEAKTASPLSQFETTEHRMRVVLLGASNLSIMFPTVVATTRAALAKPLEMHVAKGFGRSYGQQSKFFGKKFPGILQTNLWSALSRATPSPTAAILADIGNDLAYETPVDKIIDWVQQALDRLQAADARVVLNNIPLGSLQRVGVARFHVARELLFPSCKLSRSELLRRAEDLSGRLQSLAEERKTPIFSGEIGWYGLDPIHPRRSCSAEIWRRMLGALTPLGGEISVVRAAPATSLRLHRLKPESWIHFGVQRRALQPNATLSDGTTIALY